MELNALFPLDRFYQLAELPFPAFSRALPDRIPQPQRKILVHADDMTPTIEHFYGEKVTLAVSKKFVEDDSLFRQVVLVTKQTAKIVVFGAIRIYLSALPPAARDVVLECRTPLGTILHEHKVIHGSFPQRYFSITADVLIGEALQVAAGSTLYGRVNVIENDVQQKIVEVVEILPPFVESQTGALR